MAALKVRATSLVFYDNELKNVGSVFFLVDLKDESGKVVSSAEKQFSPKSMERITDGGKDSKGKSAEKAQADSDAKAEDNRISKELTKGAAVAVTDPPKESPI
jgi:hypothetical protein